MFGEVISKFIKESKSKENAVQGFNLFIGGKVSNLVLDEGFYRAEVEDNGKKYSVNICIDDDKIYKEKCSCSSKEICSHIYAVLYYIDSLKDNEDPSNWFDFSLKDIYLNDSSISTEKKDIKTLIKETLEKTSKENLDKIIINEVGSDTTLGYKLLSQLNDFSAKDEGMLFKSRIIDIIDKVNNSGNEYNIEEMVYFFTTLLQIISSRVSNGRLENGFILSMLLIEVLNSIKLHSSLIHYETEYSEFIKNKLIPELHILVLKTAESGNSHLQRVFLNELTLFVNRNVTDKNMIVCNYLLYFSALLSDKLSEKKVRSSLRVFKKRSQHLSGRGFSGLTESGLKIRSGDYKELVNFIEKKVRNTTALKIIVDTLLYYKKYDEAEIIIKHTAERNLGKSEKQLWYMKLQEIYNIRGDKEKILDNALMLFSLGNSREYHEIRKMLIDLSKYDKEKGRLHDISCKNMGLYEYCLILSENEEFDYIVDRFSRIKTSKEVKSAIEFMDDRGIALYSGGVNKKLLEILKDKCGNNAGYKKHITSLLELISI